MEDGPCLDANVVAALVGGDLAGEARQRVEDHLDLCGDCRDEVAALARQDGLVTRVEGRDEHSESGATTVPRRSEATPSAALGWGDRVDHYRIERLLGRGGSGEVYLARDTKLGRRVALKMVGHNLGAHRSVERFMREARTTARVNHPNIVTVHGVGEYGGRPYLALEYVKGRTLRQWMSAFPDRALEDSLAIGLSIAEALVEAHRHGVLHRDLKPENVIVGDDGRVRVVDFGLAETLPSEEVPPSTRAEVGPIVTGLAGTPRYMAPEQWREEECSGATDVWALGVILYELTCRGSHPFSALDSMRDLVAVVCDAEVAPKSLGDHVPERVRTLLERCLARDPPGRPSAAEVVAALRALLDAPASTPPRILAIAATAAAVVLAVTGLALAAAIEPPPRLAGGGVGSAADVAVEVLSEVLVAPEQAGAPRASAEPSSAPSSISVPVTPRPRTAPRPSPAPAAAPSRAEAEPPCSGPLCTW